MPSTTRVYPMSCTSAYCGKGAESCPACPHFPAFQEFKEWVRKTDAIVTDRIWSPLVYVAQKSAQ